VGRDRLPDPPGAARHRCLRRLLQASDRPDRALRRHLDVRHGGNQVYHPAAFVVSSLSKKAIQGRTMTTGPNTGKNRKKVLIVGRMPQAGIDVLKGRDDVDYEILTNDTVPSLHPKLKDAHAVTLGGTPFRQAELSAAPEMMVVARLGVGFDAVEIPALNKRKI